jgi:hypothetical protein
MKKKTVENALHPAVIGHRAFVFFKGVVSTIIICGAMFTS